MILRPFNSNDTAALVDLCNDIVLAQQLSRLPHPYTKESANYFVNTVCQSKTEQVWAIEVNDKLIGAVSLTAPSTHSATERIQDLTLGIWLGRSYWRQGHATKALSVLFSTVFTASTNVEYSIVAQVFQDNIASLSMLQQKCGFKVTGTVDGETSLARPNVTEIPSSILRLNRFHWQECQEHQHPHHHHHHHKPSAHPQQGHCSFHAVVVATLFVLGSSMLTSRVSTVLHATNPTHGYMDEIFHVPQTQKYCDHLATTTTNNVFNMFWQVPYDNKITTPPGLYIIASVVLTTIMPTDANQCSPQSLRSINIGFQVGTLFLLYNILGLLQLQPPKNHEKRSSATMLLQTIMLISSPVHFFCGFLFYTDSASTFFTLLSYYLTLRTTTTRAASSSTTGTNGLLQFMMVVAAGLCALACRQNNVVWSAFCIGIVLVDHLSQHKRTALAAVPAVPAVPATDDPAHICHIFPSILSWSDVPQPIQSPLSPTVELSSFMAFVQSPTQLGRFLGNSTILGHCVVVVAFIYCFVQNEYAVVLGDKSNHVPMIHTTQLLYFILYTSTMLSTQWFDVSSQGYGIYGMYCRLTTAMNARSLCMYVMIPTLCLCWSVKHSSPIHPFILADNRHYVFYLFKNALKKKWVQYGLIPVYMVLGWGTLCRLRATKSLLWCIGLIVCTGLVLVPAHLVEFRYFTIPAMLWQMHMLSADGGGSGGGGDTAIRCKDWWSYGVTIAIHACINGIVMWVFLYKTFEAPDGSVGRFMW